MFEQNISIFKSFDSEPKTIPLAQWVKVCTKGSRYAKQVELYRSTGDQQIKKALPLATVGAVCEGGRKLEDVTHRTGWIALDVDGKDNPHIKDAAALRDEIAKITYVAYAGLSVSAKGVWALVKVKHPDRQAEHFQQLITDFESRNIILDSTKGKNPNDARFYSYDPEAYITKDFKIYDRLPKEQPLSKNDKGCNRYNTPVLSNTDKTDKYGQAAFEDEINILSRTPEGNRNHQLFKSTAALASLVAGGVLNRQEVERALFDTALSIGLKEYEIKRTIQSGFDTGLKEPRRPEPKPGYSARANHAPQRDKPVGSKYESQNIPEVSKNDKTGVKLNSKGYPASWDEVQPESEFEQLKQQDPKVGLMEQLFDAVPKTQHLDQ